jgi:hypothetical protein
MVFVQDREVAVWLVVAIAQDREAAASSGLA